MDVTKRLLDESFVSTHGMTFRHRDTPESAIADLCLQPVERSYTVESLGELLAEHGFEYCVPCVNQFDKASGQFLWNLSFQDDALRHRYESLSDPVRWQVTNLLLLERSPMLWFYVQRTDSGRPRRSEQQLCHEFLERRFDRVQATKAVYVGGARRPYSTSGKSQDYPPAHSDPKCISVIEEIEDAPGRSIGDVFAELGIRPDFANVNRLRLMLTTCAFPYLISADLAG